MQRGRDRFKRPDVRSFISSPQIQDAVDRVVAAGRKIMFAPAMRDELKAEINRPVPVPQKLAEGVVGLMLMLDGKSKGGIPMEALFPATIELLGEASEAMAAAGQPVDQETFNEAARMAFVLMARKLGASDEDIMGAAQSAAPAEAEMEGEA
jgi:hypothetical protein